MCDKNRCLECGRSNVAKVIYLGLPMRLCLECSTLYGFWAWVPGIYFNGGFMVYRGPYLNALWHWIIN